MKIGCVKEIKNNEYRVGLTPDNVRAYIAAGHHVYIEKGAGTASKVIKKLKKGKTYYVRIRAFKKTGGKTYYSEWSAIKSKKVKK